MFFGCFQCFPYFSIFRCRFRYFVAWLTIFFSFFPKLLDSGKHVCKHMHGVAKVMHKPCRIVFQLLWFSWTFLQRCDCLRWFLRILDCDERNAHARRSCANSALILATSVIIVGWCSVARMAPFFCKRWISCALFLMQVVVSWCSLQRSASTCGKRTATSLLCLRKRTHVFSDFSGEKHDEQNASLRTLFLARN